MNQISKRLEQAIAEVVTMPVDQQDLIAIEIIERARDLSQLPTRLSPGERADLEASLVAARRGVRATDAVVAAMYAKHGL